MYGIGLSNFGKPIFLEVRNNYRSFIQLVKGTRFPSNSELIYKQAPEISAMRKTNWYGTKCQ